MSWVSHHERKVKKIDFIHCFVHKINSSSYDAIKARCAERWLITEVNDTFKKWKNSPSCLDESWRCLIIIIIANGLQRVRNCALFRWEKNDARKSWIIAQLKLFVEWDLSRTKNRSHLTLIAAHMLLLSFKYYRNVA